MIPKSFFDPTLLIHDLRFELKETSNLPPFIVGLKVSETSARCWLYQREQWYLSLGAVIHWTWAEQRFIATLEGETIADVSIQEAL